MSFTIAPAESFAKSARAESQPYEPTPFDETVQTAEDGAAFDVPVKNAEEAVQAVSLLNKSVRHFGRYVRVRYLLKDRTPVKRGTDGIKIVQFQVKNESSRTVRYTADDIRAWAEENDLPTTGGGKTGNAIPAETRAAFWEAVKAAETEADETVEA